ncbi:hypothetical protein [Myceligenerans indicum]|uniref:hypothetical protein n=1 Tax=Myceligenerans indicum TaxID=2593663 RepID=UPI00191F2839|nr:hypothetical protein [Myceligenerans indicum]
MTVSLRGRPGRGSTAAAGAGIGGQAVLLEVEGTPVFVKQVRLTDLERRPQNLHSTANLFDLPMFCHYGVGTIGGPGFGAWRELAVHTMTTDWVLAGDHEGLGDFYRRFQRESRTTPYPQQAHRRRARTGDQHSPVRR